MEVCWSQRLKKVSLIPNAQKMLLQSSSINSPPVSGMTNAEGVVGEGLGRADCEVEVEAVDDEFVAVGVAVCDVVTVEEGVGVLVAVLPAIWVAVGVLVAVFVGGAPVFVGVLVAVLVGGTVVLVGVLVEVFVGGTAVFVGVFVEVLVGGTDVFVGVLVAAATVTTLLNVCELPPLLHVSS